GGKWDDRHRNSARGQSRGQCPARGADDEQVETRGRETENEVVQAVFTAALEVAGVREEEDGGSGHPCSRALSTRGNDDRMISRSESPPSPRLARRFSMASPACPSAARNPRSTAGPRTAAWPASASGRQAKCCAIHARSWMFFQTNRKRFFQ